MSIAPITNAVTLLLAPAGPRAGILIGSSNVCPAGKVLTSTGTLVKDSATLLYRASKHGCDACELKPRCCPKMPTRKVPRSIYENARNFARDIAKTETYVTSRRERKKIEMLFAHLKRILRQAQAERPVRCSRRVPPRCYSPEPPKAGKADPAARPNTGPRANELARA